MELEPRMIVDLGMKFPTSNSTKKSRYALYECMCGNEFESQVGNVKSKSTISCGCYKIKKAVSNNTTHGFKKHILYSTWNNMMSRCNNKNSQYYNIYGARGISVCDRWNNVENFIQDMLPSYKKGLSIDRINPNGNYELSNCRWTTPTVQARNTRILRVDNSTGFRGVYKRNISSKHTSSIRVNGKTVHIGSFNTAEDAAKAYNRYVIDNKLEHTLNINVVA